MFYSTADYADTANSAQVGAIDLNVFRH